MNKEVGRNDPCPCGSGKKFKKCCELKPLGTHKATVITSTNSSLLGNIAAAGSAFTAAKEGHRSIQALNITMPNQPSAKPAEEMPEIKSESEQEKD